MTVVFDLLGVQNRDHGERGIARYVANLALALEADHPDLVDHYLVHPELPIPGSLNSILSTGKVIRADDPSHEAIAPTAGGVFICGSLFELEQSLASVLPVWARTPYWRRVAVLYDLIPLRFSSQYLADSDLKLRYLTRVEALKMFDHLVAISEASAADAVELAGISPERLSSIGAGADTRFRPPAGGQAGASARLVSSGRFPGLGDGYLLFPTGFDFRKNIDRFVRSYAALDVAIRDRHQLVMMCGLNEAQHEYMVQLAAEVGLSREHLILTGRVTDDELVALNQAAHLVAFPSLYEGFGLPVLEARQCGAAVICGDNSSLREIQPELSARFNASSVSEMTSTLNRVLTRPGEVDRLRALPVPQFSWADSAKGTAKVINGLSSSRVTAPLPRLGLVSPLPPQQTGIATYTARLVDYLQFYADITVFVETDEISGELPPAPPGVEVLPLSQLTPMVEGGGAFDELLFFMGNSRYHIGAVDALKRHSGTVLFHDVRMSGLYNEAQRLGRNDIVSVGQELALMYPGRYRASLEQQSQIDAEDASRFGVLMSRAIAQDARRVLVHSEYAATLVQLDTGASPEVCFALPAPPVDPVLNDESAFVISSFGVVDPAKMPEAILEAVADVKEVHPELALNFVGPVDPSYQRDLELVARRLGIGDIVSFTGHLSELEFAAAQRATTIAVQLRARSNGESSAAVPELLAAGIPTVVSDLGSMSDLPDEIVVKVPPSNTAGELSRVLLDLAREPERRQTLAAQAQSWAASNSFESAAAKLANILFG